MMRLQAASTFWHNSLYMFFNQFRPAGIPTERKASAAVRSVERRHGTHVFVFVCLILCTALSARAQQTMVPTVAFTCDFPGSEPDHYVISVSDDGNASYDSDGKLSPESAAGDPYHSDFTLSQAAHTRVFDLAKRAHYFEGQIDSKNKNLASTGTKTLTYADAQKNTRATYNYSPVPAVQELTNFFQALSATLEFGRRLDYYLHYQKLALDEELKKMEEMWNSHQIQEISSVATVLQKIADDPTVIKVVRARAQHLLQLAVPKGK
jgi:hypothetical protein